MLVKDFLEKFRDQDCRGIYISDFIHLIDTFYYSSNMVEKVIDKYGDYEIESFHISIYNYEEPFLSLNIFL